MKKDRKIPVEHARFMRPPGRPGIFLERDVGFDGARFQFPLGVEGAIKLDDRAVQPKKNGAAQKSWRIPVAWKDWKEMYGRFVNRPYVAVMRPKRFLRIGGGCSVAAPALMRPAGVILGKLFELLSFQQLEILFHLGRPGPVDLHAHRVQLQQSPASNSADD
jgi:hypothetical protein